MKTKYLVPLGFVAVSLVAGPLGLTSATGAEERDPMSPSVPADVTPAATPAETQAESMPVTPPTESPTAQSAAKSPIVTSVGITNQRPINVANDGKKRRGLKVEATVRGATDPAPEVRVELAQYSTPNGRRLKNPTVPSIPVELGTRKSNQRRTTLAGRIAWPNLSVLSSDLELGESALLCVQKVSARVGDERIPLSTSARGSQRGGSCVQLMREAPKPKKTNVLLTGELQNVELQTSGTRQTITYTTDDFSYFRDRPDRTARTVRFAALSNTERWKKLFGSKSPIMETAIAGQDDFVTIKLRRPTALGDNRYRSRVTFPSAATYGPGDLQGKNLVVFANPLPEKRLDPSKCQDAPDLTDYIPNQADFIGRLGTTKVKAKKGHLVLQSTTPDAFNWFLSQGLGCVPKFTGKVDFAKLADAATWARMFGDIRPNSSIMWKSGGRTQTLEFVQSQPRFNARTGKWVSRIRPLSNGPASDRAKTRAFREQYGKQLKLRSAYLFMDSTNSLWYGGERWVVDDNFEIDLQVRGTDFFLEFTLDNNDPTNNSSGWMGITFHEFMFPGDSIVAWWEGGPQSQGQGQCLDLYNPGIPTLPNFPSPVQDTTRRSNSSTPVRSTMSTTSPWPPQGSRTVSRRSPVSAPW